VIAMSSMTDPTPDDYIRHWLKLAARPAILCPVILIALLWAFPYDTLTILRLTIMAVVGWVAYKGGYQTGHRDALMYIEREPPENERPPKRLENSAPHANEAVAPHVEPTDTTPEAIRLDEQELMKIFHEPITPEECELFGLPITAAGKPPGSTAIQEDFPTYEKWSARRYSR
jgi:hypothetical protein